MINAIRKLFGLLGRYQKLYLMSALLLMLSIAFRSLEPKILQITIDHVVVLGASDASLGNEDPDAVASALLNLLPPLDVANLGSLLLGVALMYVVIALMRGGLLFSSDALKAWCAEKAGKGLRDRLFDHVQQLPLSYFTTTTRGELIQRITGDVDTVRGFLKGQIINLIRIVTIFIFGFTLIAMINWEYALICLTVSPLIGISSYLFFKKERKIWKEHEAEQDKLNNLVQENLNGIRTVIAYNNQDYEIEKFYDQNEKKRGMGLRQNVLHTFFWPLSDFLGFLQISVSIIAGGYFAMKGEMSVGELLSSYSYLGMVAWPMRQLGRTLSELGIATVAMERLREIEDAKVESKAGEKPEKLQGHLRFEHVYFRYKPTDEWVLKDVSFEVQAGEKIAFVGPTGAGKSTLIKLLLALYKPQKGQIYLDGKPLDSYAPEFLREQIGLALQKAFLFSTTIKDNIAYAKPESPLEDVMAAAQVAQFSEISNLFTDGYETMVGEKGVTLSGGQKQRVALARTLLPAPQMLILDDITSALDTETEQALFQAIQDSLREKTAFILSHRITSIQQADRILVLDEGQIVQEGTHEELHKIPGYYQEIHQIQTAVEAEILK
ncbi:MAG: ABC transporter ATP-binding protein [Bacteroidota bacterium]